MKLRLIPISSLATPAIIFFSVRRLTLDLKRHYYVTATPDYAMSIHSIGRLENQVFLTIQTELSGRWGG